MGRREIPGVGGIVFDDAGRLLLVRRANPPSQGRWSLPGGRVEDGENDELAVVREVAEESGLRVRAERLGGSVRLDAPAGGVFVIHVLLCTLLGGVLAAGDDASEAGWFSRHELDRLLTSPGLIEALAEWDTLPTLT